MACCWRWAGRDHKHSRQLWRKGKLVPHPEAYTRDYCSPDNHVAQSSWPLPNPSLFYQTFVWCFEQHQNIFWTSWRTRHKRSLSTLCVFAVDEPRDKIFPPHTYLLTSCWWAPVVVTKHLPFSCDQKVVAKHLPLTHKTVRDGEVNFVSHVFI